MDYKEAWEDMRRWLNQGIDYVDGYQKELLEEGKNVHEHIRIRGKLDGMKTCLSHMDETEKIYGGNQ